MQKPQKAKRGKSLRARKTPALKPSRRAKTSLTGISRGSKEGHPHSHVTKAAKILALLQQSDGATLKRIMVLTGWQAHSVRGFISGQLVKKLRIQVQSLRRDGERVYKIGK
jgi:hypothetical protein